MKPEVAQKIIEQTKKDYDAIASDFDRTRQYLWPGIEAFKKYIKPGDKILDTGCGNGRLVKLFSDVNIDYTGLDNSVELIKRAKDNFPAVNFVLGDILNLPFSDSSFDVVFCLGVLHHFPGKEFRQKALKEIRRVLKSNGFLMLSNWHYFSPKMFSRLLKSTLAKISGISELDFGDTYIGWGNTRIKRYVHFFTKFGIKKLLKTLDFKIAKNYISEPTQRGFKNIVTITEKC